jgi:hypothetical protein
MFPHNVAPARLWPGAAVPFLMLAGGAALVGLGNLSGATTLIS